MPSYRHFREQYRPVDYDRILYRLLAFSCHLPALASVVDAGNGQLAILIVGSVSVAAVKFTRQMPELSRLALTILFYLLLLVGVDYCLHIQRDGETWFWQRIVPVVQLAVLYYAFEPEVRWLFGRRQQQSQPEKDDDSKQLEGEDSSKPRAELITLGMVAIVIVLQSAATANFAPTEAVGWMSYTILFLHAVIYFVHVCVAIYGQLRDGQVGTPSSKA